MEKSRPNPGAAPRPPACFPKNLGCSPFPSGLHSEIRKTMVAGETAAEVHKDFGPAGFHLGRFGGPKKKNGPRKELSKIFLKKTWFFKKNCKIFKFENEKRWFLKKKL